MVKKTIIFILTFLTIYVANFFIPRLMPGDPLSFVGNEEADDMPTTYSEEEIEKLKVYYGLDKPVGEQFISYVKANLKGDFGHSIYYKDKVANVVMGRLPWTLYIMCSSLTISLIIGVIMALWAIKNKRVDNVLYGATSIFVEIPSFLIGILLLFLIAAKVKAIPLSGNLTPFAEYSSPLEFVYDAFIHSLLPITAMVVITIPRFFFTARASFLTVQNKKYVLNAKSMGLSERKIKYKYILLNGIFPVVAAFFLSAGSAIGGTLLIENVFAYPGLGKILREAVRFRDYPLIQGIFMLSTLVVLICSYISDMINQLIKKD